MPVHLLTACFLGVFSGSGPSLTQTLTHTHKLLFDCTLPTETQILIGSDTKRAHAQWFHFAQ